MSKPEPSKPLPPLPLLLVFGKTSSPNLPQASWFLIEDRATVAAAAHALKLTVIDIATEADRDLLTGVHEGVLKGNGRIIVGSVAVEVYQRIEEHVRARASGSGSPIGGNIENGRATLEQKTNSEDRAATAADAGKAFAAVEPKTATAAPAPALSPAAARSDPWDKLRIGSHVVAKCWDDNREAIGWWTTIAKPSGGGSAR
jgi:hypothetical protein